MNDANIFQLDHFLYIPYFTNECQALTILAPTTAAKHLDNGTLLTLVRIAGAGARGFMATWVMMSFRARDVTPS